MKKLLLVFVILAGVVHQDKAMNSDIKDKDFSKQFFREFQNEYSSKQDSLEQRKDQLMRRKTSLETNINLKRLNLRNKEKDLEKSMKRSNSVLSSFMNILDSITVANESMSISSDVNELRPILAELNVVLNESSSNIKLYTVIQGLQSEYPANRLKNPYLKTVKTSNPFVESTNKKESKQYDEALFSLNVTKKIIEHDLSNVSWFQWLWNYRAYKNYQKSIQMLDEEIALFKDQDRVVSPKKMVYSTKNFLQTYSKPQLTHREVFTRSNMPKSLFEQVKAARE
jgi:hypothetical protein